MAPSSFSRAALAAALLLGATLAGCAAPAVEAPVEVADAAAAPPPSGQAVLGPAAPPDTAASLAEAPRLVEGEWWKIRYSSRVFGDTPELVRVVADVQEEGYVVGMPHESWFKEAVALHAPGFGDIGFDLSYGVHGERFEPVRFPLVEGATWNTTFAGAKLTATVESVDEFTATIRFEPPPSEPGPADAAFVALAPEEFQDFDASIRLVYDARQHEVVRFEAFLGTWEVVEHGYGFEGWVTIPRGPEHVIDHGQFLAATPGEPLVTRTQLVEGGFNRMTLFHAIIAVSPGAYRVRAVAPDGTELVTESLASRGFVVGFHEVADPDGAWTLEDVVGGVGVTYSMGIAYHQYDIRLPDGARRADHSHAVIR